MNINNENIPIGSDVDNGGALESEDACSVAARDVTGIKVELTGGDLLLIKKPRLHFLE